MTVAESVHGRFIWEGFHVCFLLALTTKNPQGEQLEGRLMASLKITLEKSAETYSSTFNQKTIARLANFS